MTAKPNLSLVEAEPPAIDAEYRLFVGRLMTGYESAHRRVADLCDTLSARLEQAEGTVARALDMQLKLAAEREELLSARHSRELEARLVEQRGEVIADIGRDVRSLLPLAAKRFLGAPLTGNDSHGLQALLSTFDEQQVEDIIVGGQLKLTEGQRLLLGAVFQDLAKSEKEGDK